MSALKAQNNQHIKGKRPRIKRPNSFVAKRLTQAGRDLVAFLVWEAGSLAKAPERLGVSRSWVAALAASPPVIQHMNEQLDVRRKGERPRNFSRLLELREQDDNKTASVAAIRTLEQVSDDHARGGLTVNISPGFVVHVKEPASHAPHIIDGRVADDTSGKPMIEHVNSDNDALTTVDNDDEDTLWVDGRAE